VPLPQDEFASALLESLLERARLAVAFWDRELRFLKINEAAAEPNTQPPEEHVGRTFSEVVGPTVAAAAEPQMRRVLETGEPISDVNIAGQWPDGSSRVYLTTFFPIVEDGEVVGVGAVGLDTSGVVARELDAAVRAAEYQRALRDYSTLLRHRLATPLSSIRGAAETLRSHVDLDDATRRRLVDLIAEQGAELERLALEPDPLDASEESLRPRPDVD